MVNAELIENSWNAALPLGVDAIGKLFYQRVFTNAPDLISLFSFKDEPDMFDSEKFRVHAAKVIGTVDKAVKNVRTLDKLVPVLKALGGRHLKYGVKQEHYPIIGKSLLETLAMGLGDAFTADVRASWEEVVGIIATTMLEGTAEAEKAAAEKAAAAASE